ncbi:hypothetical protein Mal4_04410 [Maioricimonas rarisocia]|uniref:Uncharacterized protein n=1 Tax=Maioricimonas rarisocia TaxID=2528026 RepID=A0A517Z104_9PLAN|nr:hypothetical protein [Maioricimonas rarisocia]QDU36158.1 hypothetical protein Mal4_04410 [Maioricimonas rarisocia]
MSRTTCLLIALVSFAAGQMLSGDSPRAGAQPPSANDTSPQAISRVRKALTGSKWDLGEGDWQQFLSDMKTTNQLNRTGNWVVTDEKTLLTGGRGLDGAVYIWKLDPKLQRAVISKYERVEGFQRKARRVR